MATQTTNYQCPGCTGPLHFVGESGQLECDYCGAHYEVAAIEQLYAAKDAAAAAAGTAQQWDLAAAGGNWSDEELAHLRGYTCQSCGAALVCDDTTAATACPYCGNQTIVPGQLAGALKPDFVMPFKLDKNAATTALAQYYKGKRFLPKAFMDTNHVDEIKGVYVPCWLFDSQLEAAMTFHGTISRSRREGRYEVTTVDHYQVVRQGQIAFSKVPVNGSSKMPEAHMDSIEPFAYAELKDYSPAYLPGFLADRYDRDAQTCSVRAQQRMEKSTEEAITATAAGYTSLTKEHSQIVPRSSSVKYALLPVWLLSTTWKEKTFLFAMNGQTGKLIGDLPVDRGKFWGWYAVWAGGLGAILALILFVLWPLFGM